MHGGSYIYGACRPNKQRMVPYFVRGVCICEFDPHRYPKSVKLLRSYGKFLEHVKNDPWGAARYHRSAEEGSRHIHRSLIHIILLSTQLTI